MEEDKVKIETDKIDKEQVKKQEEQELPAYFRPLEIAEEEETRIVDEIFEEFDAIKKEREELGLDDKWERLLNQYKGILEEDQDRQFNLNRPTTKIKVRGCARMSHQAFFETDPKYEISPRPEFAKETGYDVCEKQTDFLDYKMDTEMQFAEVKRKVINFAFIIGIGIEKMYHKLRRRKRIRSENWKGEPKQLLGRFGTVVQNKPLEELLKKYPEAPKKYIEQLSQGKEINIKVEYMETVKNDPLPKFVDPRNFYVRPGVDGYEGLTETRLIVERVEYFWWELEMEERRGFFRNIDELKYKYKDGKKGDINKGYKSEKYNILECTYLCKLKESDKEEVKCVFWIEENSKICIGDSNYPWESVECIYNPHYINKEEEGFYQPGLAEDLTDLHLAENLFLNFGLEGAYVSNMVTPITKKNSDIDRQFISKTWAHGMPLYSEGDDKPDFLQKYMKATSLPDIIAVLQILAKAEDDVSGHSQLMTGRESEIDPSAPASKTIALMRQSGVNVQDYIKCLLPAFNRTADMLLQMYYQISKEGRKYRMNREKMETVGEDPFGTIERWEMAARTNIEAKALSFSFDKMNEKKLDLALYQVVRQELLVAKRPESVHTLLKHIIKGWSPKWKNIVEKILPSLEQIKKEEQSVVTRAIAQYLEIKNQQAQQKGIQPQINPEEISQVAGIARKDMVTPPSPEEQKARQNA